MILVIISDSQAPPDEVKNAWVEAAPVQVLAKFLVSTVAMTLPLVLMITERCRGQASSSYRPEYHHDTQRWRRATEYDDYDRRSQERTGDHQRQLDSDEDYDRRSQEHFEYRQPQSDRDEDYGQKHKYHRRPLEQGGSSYRP